MNKQNQQPLEELQSDSRATQSEPSRAKTLLWLIVATGAYIGIQWTLPKVGLSS